MRPTLALLALVPLLASARLTARQGTAADEAPLALDDPCAAKCDDGAQQQIVATGCQEDESVCLCDNTAYISWIENCLNTNCPADKVDAMKAEIKDSCDLIREYMSTAVDPSSSTLSTRASGIAGVASSVASLTSTVTLGSPTTRPSASASATGSGIAALPSAASSVSSAASSARNAASSSSAWAMPTAVPGVMCVMAVAAGALLA